MDKPENGIIIIPKIVRTEDNVIVVIVGRGTIVDGNAVLKEGLSVYGDWIAIPEGREYPDVCFLKASTVDKILEKEMQDKWDKEINNDARQISAQLERQLNQNNDS